MYIHTNNVIKLNITYKKLNFYVLTTSSSPTFKLFGASHKASLTSGSNICLSF